MTWSLRRKNRTGPTDITARIPPATAGNLLIQRRGDTVWCHFKNLVVSDTARPDMIMSDVIPAGYQPADAYELALAPRVSDSASETKGAVRVYGATMVLYRVPANGTVRGLVSWPTNDPMPGGAA